MQHQPGIDRCHKLIPRRNPPVLILPVVKGVGKLLIGHIVIDDAVQFVIHGDFH
ncbi:hypothetical protein D3C83_216010 [compost metagenome]